MQLINKATKFFYLACLLLVLSQLGEHISKPQVRSYLSTTKQILLKLGEFWQEKRATSTPPVATIPSLHRTQPLVMNGGDPYVRALMRTITASEANVKRPYNVIYGGRYVEDLSRHPELCIPIVAGPNVGQCTTAAGRYQMLDFTWDRQAKKYHPSPSGIWRWRNYSFEAEYQDVVVHDWLSDSNVWGANIPQQLRKGEITQVLKLLSGTWTSLGYGIETNSMSNYLPQIYQNVLQEELS
ncbi:glycoside hydrolase family protein [Waterburya agarophytonicola K14]|uniref:Glycoside hydrolase family protein n=1 Tax=Waterburya agarophytonicola KI4 TaxID=2874699 RepID=A0A964FGH3_9CYAN|nr:glycoside hydrolase family protein [Waterburya agarophytonicola]MCC0176609.1 glycoside hydrolase family protein [Waterburya agarophytonicola KI4]